jgi:selenocysteine lyase/cysteine desulfurase
MSTTQDATDRTLAFLRMNEIGRRARIRTPSGARLICYADLTATGRYLHLVEAWIQRMRPFYANTHTDVSSTGRIIGALREEARSIVRRGVGAGENHQVLFCGAGATAAVNKLVGLLGLRIPELLERRYNLSQHIPAAERPVVFVGPYEHHSNYLPWRESICDVVEIPANPAGEVDLDALRTELRNYADRPLRIGAFSAGSNVTGCLSDVPALTETLRAGAAKVVLDYAACGPYVPINMSPGNPAHAIDAIFVSTHKFLGGPGGSGLLVADRDLFPGHIPERPGGGTVDYVGSVDIETVDYVEDLEVREEGGTPSISADLRAGTAFLVKELVGAEVIRDHELEIGHAAMTRLAAHPRIRILGPTELPRLAIISFDVEGLHHDFVSGLLDELFGIQSRAGCACAGPYGHRLLDIDEATSERFRALVQRRIIGMKPGWVRISLPYYASAEDVEFVLSAVEFVCDHGPTLLPAYELDWSDAVWRRRGVSPERDLPLELSVESLQEAAQSLAAGDHETPISERGIQAERERYFEEARAFVETVRLESEREPPTWNRPTGDAEVDALAWFQYAHATPFPG